MSDSDQAALADQWADPDGFNFTISVGLQREHDPVQAIQWMVQHIVIGLQTGNLPIRAIGPEGTVYLWFPECRVAPDLVVEPVAGKTPADWLVNTQPQRLPVHHRVAVPPGMTRSEARHILAQAAQERPASDANE